MQKISELTLAERDDYVCRQSIAVLQACGYDMPLEVALDYLLDSESQDGYRFDVLDCVFNWAVAGAECNTVIELKLEHHAA